uniref:Uncharacterized protein n=1 Tax=Heterosigma akashiwo TaxID=2829 RepID=A0A7S3XRZ0_HETAK
MAPSSTSKQKLCKLAGVLYLVQYSAGFTSVVPNQTPSGIGISKGTIRVEGGVTLWASEEGSDGSSSAQQASGYAARRRNTKLTYGGKRQKKQPKAIRFKDIESLEELQELETQMQQETTEQVELVQKVQPEQVELEPEQVEPEPEQVEPELEQPSLSESLSSQGSDDLMQVTMGGQSMFLPVARAEILIAAGAAERIGAAPAPAPASAPVSAEEPALVQVKMGGNTMYLEADQAEALLASGAATRVGPAPAPALDFDNPTDDPWYGRVVIFEQLDDDLNPVPNAPALAGVPLPQPKAAAAPAPAPAPAAAADPDALVRVKMGGQMLYVPYAQAQALLASGAAEPVKGNKVPVRGVGGEEEPRKGFRQRVKSLFKKED